MTPDLGELMKSAKYASLIIDGDTDISVKECEMVYVRILENGKLINRFVGQQQVEHAHAAGDYVLYLLELFSNILKKAMPATMLREVRYLSFKSHLTVFLITICVIPKWQP